MGIEICLDHDLVSEWRYKYVDYKTGKRHIKAIARAVHHMNSSTRPLIKVGTFLRRDNSRNSSGGVLSPNNRCISHFSTFDVHDRKKTISTLNVRSETTPLQDTHQFISSPNPLNRPLSVLDTTSVKDENKVNPDSNNKLGPDDAVVSSLEIHPIQEKIPSIDPITRDFAPKISRTDKSKELGKDPSREFHKDLPRQTRRKSLSLSVKTASSLNLGNDTPPTDGAVKFYKLRHRSPISSRSFLSNVFSNGPQLSLADSNQTNTGTTASEVLRLRQFEFVKWFEQEIEKVELFYKAKEDEAGVLLDTLREQLLEMRSRRVEELAEAKQARESQKLSTGLNDTVKYSNSEEITELNTGNRLKKYFLPAQKFVINYWSRLSSSFVGENTRALQNLHANPGSDSKRAAITTIKPIKTEKEDDHVRRAQYADQVPYRKAKQKLKIALFQCFRGIELLKSYTLLNQLAFRKMVKNYNQAVGTNAPTINLSGKISQAWFVKSDVLDDYLSSAVTLYAHYFECGNQKIAHVKLRGSIAPRADESAISFRNGVAIGIGIVLCIQGLLKGIKLLDSPDPVIRIQTNFLLQLYTGYFLALYLFAFFCFDCYIWTKNNINYQFVFEFDIGHTLDWRKLASVPSFLLTFLGLCMWINFCLSEASKMYIYIPVILIAATVLLVFLPAPILFHRGRRWFLYANWRLLLAGLYPVEFRDFILGDMYCSLTYVMANIEVFFCLYINHWNSPQKCGSSQSRVLGFFTTIPAIWRALQCIRRYYDTREKFPHLVNCSKYLTTILFYTTLSMYRISGTQTDVALFLIAATVNSIYASMWDVLMDWSLMQPNAKEFFLRDVRGYRKLWWYYGALILNPILRFDWILYSANMHVLGHSSKVTFFIAFAEVTRRGIWILFRVENEHCSNVARHKASHDPQLPYTTLVGPENPVIDADDSAKHGHLNHTATGTTLETQHTVESNTHRRPFARIMADAHTKDFQKRRQRGDGEISSRGPGNKSNDYDSEESSSENDGKDDEHHKRVVMEVAALVRDRKRLAREEVIEEV